MWTKFSIFHTDVSYSEFLSYHAQRYRVRNESAKCFFAEFSKDPERHDAILRECIARRAVKRGTVDPFIDKGVVPKLEPVEEGVIGPPEYVYLISDASLGGVAVAKTEQV
jgi:rubrerythrin